MRTKFCKICNVEIPACSFKQHLERKHNIYSYYEYGSRYNMIFIKKIMSEYVNITNFTNKCKVCGKEFLMIPFDSDKIEIKRCETDNCSGRSLRGVLKQFFVEDSPEFLFFKEKYDKLQKNKSTIESLMVKQGITYEQAKQKKIEWGKKAAGSLESFILRHGEEEGKLKFEQFKKNTVVSLENMIRKYGEEEGIEKFSLYIQKKKESSPWSIEYWLKKTKGNIEEARILLSQEQSRDINFFINRYGEEEGIKKFRESNNKKATTLENMVSKYGLEKGEEKYNNWKRDIGYYNTEQGLIEKFGQIKGQEKYKLNKIKRMVLPFKSYSTISKYFFEDLIYYLDKPYKYYYADNEYVYYDDKQKKVYFIDFYIKELNYAIEFNGDFWHGNPEIYDGEEIAYGGKTVKEIWLADEIKQSYIRTKVKKLDIVWEKDYKENRLSCISKILTTIKEIEDSVLQ